MTTGQSFTNFTNKRLITFKDLGDNFLTYLRQAFADSVKTRWNVDGVFDTALTLTGVADGFSIGGTSLATDGVGHVFDPASLYIAANIPFENAAATTYYVGLQYAEIPTVLGINPKTGAPEFTTYQEAIGVSGSPNSVADNGDGTATFIVDSVTESGHSHAGRTVRVFLKTPQAGTFALAVEDLTVVWDGANNKVTSTGAFGQTAISTTASDYVAVLLGPQVSASDLSALSGICFLGTLTGAGPGGTPTTSTTGQAILKTYMDASQITFASYSYLASTDVQASIQELVDDLASNGGGVPSYPGSTRLGVDPDYWTNLQDAIGFSGGLGNSSDGTYTAPTLQDVLVKLDTILQARRGWTYTFGDNAARHGSCPSTTSLAAAIDGTAALGGTHWLQRLNNAAGFPYVIPIGAIPAGAPYVIGEESGISDVTLKSNVDVQNTSHPVYGRWERVYLKSTVGTIQIGHATNGQNFQAEDFGFKAGQLTINGGPKYGQAFSLCNGIFKAPSPAEATGLLSASLVLSPSGSGDDVFHGLVENVIFEGPTTTQTSLSPTAVLDFAQTVGSINNADDQPLVFRGCVFINTRTDIPIITNHSVGNFARKVVFEDCLFVGVTGETQPLVDWNGGNIEMKRCFIYAPEGQALRILSSRFVLDDVVVMTGASGTAVANPQTVALYSAAYNLSSVRNLQVLLDTSAIRATGTATKPLVQLNGYDGNGTRANWSALDVSGLLVKQIGGTNCHRAETLLMEDSGDGEIATQYRGVVVDLQGVSPGETGTSQGLNAIVSVRGSAAYYVRPEVYGLTVRGAYMPVSGVNRSIVGVDRAEVYGLNVNNVAVNSGSYDSMVNVGTKAKIQGGVLDVHNFYTSTKGILYFSGDNSEVSGLDSFGPSVSGALGFVYMLGQYNTFKDSQWLDLDFTNYPAVYVAGSDAKIHGNRISKSAIGGQGVHVINHFNGTRRSMITNNYVSWDATVYSAVNVNNYESIVDNLIAFQQAGAAAAVNNTGTGNVVGNVITSNTP